MSKTLKTPTLRVKAQKTNKRRGEKSKQQERDPQKKINKKPYVCQSKVESLSLSLLSLLRPQFKTCFYLFTEETLVLLSFVAFLFFISHYYGQTIKESLDERGLLIKGEREDFIIKKEKSLQELLQEYQKLLAVKENLQPLSDLLISS